MPTLSLSLSLSTFYEASMKSIVGTERLVAHQIHKATKTTPTSSFKKKKNQSNPPTGDADFGSKKKERKKRKETAARVRRRRRRDRADSDAMIADAELMMAGHQPSASGTD